MTDPSFKDHEITVLVRFETGLLEIPGDLLDRRFSFGTGEGKVEVRLPREGPHAEHNGSRVGPKLFRTSELLVALFPTQTTTLPDPLPESLPLAIKADSRAFEELVLVAKAEARRAYEAFDRFSRMLRWKSMNAWILRQESAPRTQWQTNVVLRSTEQPVRGVAGSELAMVPFTITVEQWEQAERALQQDEPVPVYVDLVLDAERHHIYGDLNRCLVDATSACEIYMRRKIVESFPRGVSSAVIKYIEGATARTYYERLFPEILPGGSANQTWGEIKKDIAALFEARNAVVHRGEQGHVSASRVYDYWYAAKKLLTLG